MKTSNVKEKLLTCAIFLAVVVVYIIFKPPCPLLYFFDIPCPGCGMTRAYFSLLRLDFCTAFHFNPMFWSVPVLILYYLADWKLFNRKWVDRGVLILIGLGFLISWIVKLLGLFLG